VPWFSLTVLLIALYSYLSFLMKKKGYVFETLFSFMLLVAGLIQFFGSPWLHVVYIPLLFTLAIPYGPELIVPLSLTVPGLEMRHFTDQNLREEVVFNAVAVVTAIALSLILSRMKKERDTARKSLRRLKEAAEDMGPAAGIDVMNGENLISQYLSSSNTANEEIRESLLILGRILSADSVGMFTLKENTATFRCSTAEDQPSGVDDREPIDLCRRKRAPVLFGTNPRGVAIPVLDRDIIAGVLITRRSGPNPFEGPDIKTLEMFSGQIAKMLQRQRISSQLTRDRSALQILHKGSSNLIASLKIEGIARNLIEAAHNIAPLSMAFFVPRGDGYELIYEIGIIPPEDRHVDFGNSLVGMAVRNGEPIYLSDLRNNKMPVLPFKAGQVGSVFMLPLLYEKELLGLLVFLSERPGALNSYQIELLGVLGNQASASLVNARLHSEIERLAVTDGLTGLFNHRHFQEKLSLELNRLQRLPHPLSLLLVDIDFFKKINDAYGHPAGDVILKGVAAIVKTTVRNTDIPARYGGEEFAAVLAGTDREGAMTMAERLRKSVEGKGFLIDGKEVRVTVSIGAATAPYDAEEREQLISRADEALYHAKENGRNRSVLWHEIP